MLSLPWYDAVIACLVAFSAREVRVEIIRRHSFLALLPLVLIG
jgi:hypothetical protein